MLELIAEIREKTGNQVKELRRQKSMPAVLYRKGKVNVNLQLNYDDFKKIFKEAGESTVIKLKIQGQSERVDLKTRERNVLVAEVARDPINDRFLHVDFHEIRMDEQITVDVPLVFVNESPLVKAESGTLVKNFQEIKVRALPNDLPRQIEVDISQMQTFDDHICIKDLKMPKQVKVLAEPEEVVALVVPPRKEEVVTEVPAPLAEETEKPAEEVKEGTTQEKAGQENA